jgi:hypothetical protein
MIKFIKYEGTKRNYRDLRVGDSVWLNGVERKISSIQISPESFIIGVEGRKLKFSNLESDFPLQLAEDSIPVIKRNCIELISLEELKESYNYDEAVKLLHKVFLRTVEIIDRASPDFINFIRNLDPYDLWGPGIENQVYEKTGIKKFN